MIFLVRRLISAVAVLWVVATLVFVLYFIAPHDPARLLAGRQATPHAVDAVRRTLGLDQPLPRQYGHYLARLAHADLGVSFKNKETVWAMMARALPVDISLGAGAAVIWLGLGVGIGVRAARRPRGIADRSATIFVLTFVATPTFVLGLMLSYLLWYLPAIHGMHWLSPPGYDPLSDGIGQWARALVLPWMTLGLVNAATYSRLTRSALLDVLGEDFIRTARAKGLSERRVVYRHALRSALTPLVSQFGVDIGTAFGGVILVETVFSLNGLGELAVNSIAQQDLPVVMGIVLVGAAFIVIANVLVDIAYARLDPRVRAM